MEKEALGRKGPKQAPPPAGVGVARWRLCVHEAGHILVAAALGCQVERVAVAADASGGTATYGHRRGHADYERIAAAVAGGLAEHYIGGRPWDGGCVSPLDRANIDRELPRDPARAERVEVQAAALAKQILRRDRGALLAVANALARSGQIEGGRLAALLQDVEPVGSHRH